MQAYASFLWDHMGREEGVILPAAQRHLNDADWADIDAAFRMNRDPHFGSDSDKEYRQLFSRIVNAAPGWQSVQGTQAVPAPMALTHPHPPAKRGAPRRPDFENSAAESGAARATGHAANRRRGTTTSTPTRP